MIRGDFLTIAMQGDFKKLRPASVIKSDLFNGHATVTVLPVTSTLVTTPLLRVACPAKTRNWLAKTSQLMVDKAVTVGRDKVGPTFGRIEADAMVEVKRCLAVFLGIVR